MTTYPQTLEKLAPAPIVHHPKDALAIKFKRGDGKRATYYIWQRRETWYWAVRTTGGVARSEQLACEYAREYLRYQV